MCRAWLGVLFASPEAVLTLVQRVCAEKMASTQVVYWHFGSAWQAVDVDEPDIGQPDEIAKVGNVEIVRVDEIRVDAVKLSSVGIEQILESDLLRA